MCIKQFISTTFVLFTAVTSSFGQGSLTGNHQPVFAVPDSVDSILITDPYDKNIIKANIPSLALRTFSVQYERLVSRKISAALGFHRTTRGGVPLLNSFESLIDDPEVFDQLRNVRFANTSITPEVRFYFGKHDGARGFYIAPYARFSTYTLDFNDFEYTIEFNHSGYYYEETRSVPLRGDVRGTTGGLLFGAQWKLGKWVYLDWWILGIGYGSSNSRLTATVALNPDEQDALREELEQFELPFWELSDVSVDANGARVTASGPWLGVRGGLALGIKF